jgi:hypothetical protein
MKKKKKKPKLIVNNFEWMLNLISFFIFLEKLNQRKKHDAKVTKTPEEHKPFNYREMIVVQF